MCCYKRPKRLIEEHLFFSLSLFSGPFAKHLGCRFPSSVSSVVPLTCVVHSCTPLLSEGASHPLKKPGGTDLRYNVYRLVSVVRVPVRGKPNKTMIPRVSFSFIIYKRTKQLLSLCHRFSAKSTHNPLRSWRFKIVSISAVNTGGGWLSCLHLNQTGRPAKAGFPSSARILVKLQRCT